MGGNALTTKRCPKCDTDKPLTEFSKHRRMKDGLQPYCRECNRSQKAEWVKDDPAFPIWSSAKSRANASNLPFNLDLSDVVVPERCPVFFTRMKAGDIDLAPSLDRIRPELGYVKGNVIVISLKANRMKNNGTAAELRALADFYTRLEQQQARRSHAVGPTHVGAVPVRS